MTTAIRNLQIITLLDSISYGLLYGFLTPYILKLGGTHFHTGILSVGILLATLASPDVIKIFTHLNGKRYSLHFILNTSMVTHIMLVLTNSYYFTILIRILFSLTNQSQNICLDLLLNRATSDQDRERIRTNYSILSGSGYVIGPIISGYLFAIGFGYTGILAAVLTLINTYLLSKVSKDDKDINPEHTDKSVLEKAVDIVSQRSEDLKKSQYETNWDLLVMKYLFSSSIIIFFSKFTHILRFNYNSSSSAIGYTAAYINILVFAASYFTMTLKEKSQAYPEVFLSELCFFLLTVLLFLAYYAPYYEMFIVLLIPIVILRTLTMDIWKDLFSERKNEHLNKLNQPMNIVAGLTTPVLFGITCDMIGNNAIILFSCITMLSNWIITRFYSRNIKIDDKKVDKDK